MTSVGDTMSPTEFTDYALGEKFQTSMWCGRLIILYTAKKSWDPYRELWRAELEAPPGEMFKRVR